MLANQTHHASYSNFVRVLHHQLQQSFQWAWQHIEKEHQRHKQLYDGKLTSTHLKLVIKFGSIHLLLKLASQRSYQLHGGDHTQLLISVAIGGTKSLIVHHNRLKPCYGPPSGGQSSPPNSLPHLPVPHTPSTTLPVGSGGYTSVLPDPVTIPTVPPPPTTPPPPVGTLQSTRPQRTHRLPIRLGDFISH